MKKELSDRSKKWEINKEWSAVQRMEDSFWDFSRKIEKWETGAFDANGAGLVTLMVSDPMICKGDPNPKKPKQKECHMLKSLLTFFS